jgi:hypothetical protein
MSFDSISIATNEGIKMIESTHVMKTIVIMSSRA